MLRLAPSGLRCCCGDVQDLPAGSSSASFLLERSLFLLGVTCAGALLGACAAHLGTSCVSSSLCAPSSGTWCACSSSLRWWLFTARGMWRTLLTCGGVGQPLGVVHAANVPLVPSWGLTAFLVLSPALDLAWPLDASLGRGSFCFCNLNSLWYCALNSWCVLAHCLFLSTSAHGAASPFAISACDGSLSVVLTWSCKVFSFLLFIVNSTIQMSIFVLFF